MYYESRIEKIPKYFIENTILCTTWLADKNKNYCKPIDDDELHKCLDVYSSNKYIDHELKNKIYEGTLWYAAYCAFFAYKLYYHVYNVSEFEDYLSYCLERLLLKINDWDPKLANGASFYTRYLADVKWSIKTYLQDDFGAGLCKRGVIVRMEAAINKMLFLGYTFDSAIELEDNYFKLNFCVSKKLFIDYLKHSQIISGNTIITIGDDGGTTEVFDLVEDDYYSSFADRIMVKLTVEEILKLARTKFKEKELYFFVWKDYMTGDYSLEDLAKKYYNGNRTREAIRQTVKKVDIALKNSRKYIEFKNEYVV